MNKKSIFTTSLSTTVLCLTVACSSTAEDSTSNPLVDATVDTIMDRIFDNVTSESSVEILSTPATEISPSIFVDHIPIDLQVYNINEENYVSLPDFSSLVGTSLECDETAIHLTSHATDPTYLSQGNGTTTDLFQTVIDDIIAIYGKHETDSQTSTGLYYVSYLDFTGDGEEDLFLSYVSFFAENIPGIYEIKHNSEVWTVNNNVVQKLYENQIHHVMGGTAYINETCELIYDGEKWYIANTYNLIHRGYCTDRYQVTEISLENQIVEDLLFYTEANGDYTYFSYSLSKNNTILQEGTYLTGESFGYGSLYDYLSEQFQQDSIIPVYETYTYEKNLVALEPTTATLTTLEYQAIPTTQTIYLNNKTMDWQLFTVNDTYFVRFADLCPEMDMGVDWDTESNTIKLTTDGSDPLAVPENATFNEQFPNESIHIAYSPKNIIDQGSYWEIPVTLLDYPKIPQAEFEALSIGDTISYSLGFLANVDYTKVIAKIEPENLLRGEAYTLTFEDRTNISWSLNEEENVYRLELVGLNPSIFCCVIGEGVVHISKNTQLIDEMGSIQGADKYIADIFDFSGSQYETSSIDLVLIIENGFVTTATQHYRP